MFRVILYVIGFLIFTSVIRSVLGIIGKTVAAFSASTAANTSSHSSPNSHAGTSRQSPAGGPSQNELKKDPVCGTFISTATAFQKASGGETYYFCSAQCRDQFTEPRA